MRLNSSEDMGGACSTKKDMGEADRKGRIPVLVGKKGSHQMEKIWVSIKAINHPTIVELLDHTADKKGYQQGLLRIMCDINTFKAILDKISKE